MNKAGKKKRCRGIVALAVWLMAVVLCGCVVRMDTNVGEQPIPEKQIQANVTDMAVPEEPEKVQGRSDEAQEIPEEAQGSPEEVQEIPEEAQGSPDEAQESPEEAQGSPEEAQESPKAAQESPEAVQKIPEEAQESPEETQEIPETKEVLDPNGSYTDKAQVALYLHLYGQLPSNYITKKEAEALGWDAGKGNLEDVAPGKSIGGSRFGNREELLPVEKGRNYYECDIEYDGGYRGAKRIVYSDDGLIYYTEDHYKSFELLYTSEGKAE